MLNYYLNYIQKLKLVCDKRKAPLVQIGKVNNLLMYKIILNPLALKTAVFSAGIHGDEISGPWAIINFLKKYDLKKHPNVKIIIFPVANPTAFNKKKRYNYLGKDLNDFFCRNLLNENKILLNALKKEKIFFFCSLHENDTFSFYLYSFEKKKEKIYRDIIKLAKKYFPINNSKKIYHHHAFNGLIKNCRDGSFEDRMFRDGVPYSLCAEIPDKQSLKKRITANEEIMNKIINFINKRRIY